MHYKIDLHTHSIISPDGGISMAEYEKLLQNNLDVIAVTDHNKIDFAQKLQNAFGTKIIIGEEVTTRDGELIGLFLDQLVKPGMPAYETAKEIKQQGGIVCVPHPFEIFRRGIQLPILEKMVPLIDIVEVFNGRGRWRGKAEEAEHFSKEYNLVGVANSDAHGYPGAGKTYTTISAFPTKETFVDLLGKGHLHREYAPLWTFLYPSINRIKNMYNQ